MPIDTNQPGSPGWWMKRLSGKLAAQQRRFRLLTDYVDGRPPLAWGSEAVQTKFYKLQATSKTNFAELVVEAKCERVGVRSIATAGATTDDGDSEAWALANANDFEVLLATAARWASTYGWAYLATAMPAPGEKYAIMTVEDPRTMIHESDPVRRQVLRAAYKAYYDAEAEMDVVVLWLPGERWVATQPHRGSLRQRRAGLILGREEPVHVKFSPQSFTMAPMRPNDGSAEDGVFYSETFEDDEVAVDVVENPQLIGDFETHTDVIDRINHGILQRIVISTLQAFRQRALKQNADAPPLAEEDQQGNKIDYDALFESGPNALWLLPPGVEMWESNQVDLTGILSSVKDDVLHLSAVTGTPMSMFTPDAAAQSAEGAQLMRERMVFKVEAFQRNARRPIARAFARCFRYMDDAVRGDPAQVSIEWVPAQRYSLAEQAMAASQVGTSLTWEQQQDIIWNRTPQQIKVAKTQRMADVAIAQMMAPSPQGGSGSANGNPRPAPTGA